MNEPILYKYLDATGGTAMLFYHSLLFTNAVQLNDPFDCHPALIDFSNVPKEICRNWFPEVVALAEADRFKKNREKAWLCSLSRVYDSMLMWSYYSKHKGVCVGLDMEKTRKFMPQILDSIGGCQEWDVQYVDVVEKPNYFSDMKDFFRYQMTTKAKVWEHEQEVRLFSYDPSPKYMRLMPRHDDETDTSPLKDVRAIFEITPDCFKSLYLGVSMKKKKRAEIVEVARKCNPAIKIYQMTIDPDAFRLKAVLLND
jgi:hypothetical protein